MHKREVLVATSTGPRRLDGSHSLLLVAGNHAVDRRDRDADRPGDVLGEA